MKSKNEQDDSNQNDITEETPWKEWETSLSMFTSEFLEERNQPKIQDREKL